MHTVTIAYLINQYPKVSHTFIRREITALESLGASVERFSIRRPDEALSDSDDRAEATRTHVVLDAGFFGLLGATLLSVFTRPISLFKAALLAWRTGWRSERGLLRHGIYLAEACVLRRWLRRRGCAHVHSHFGTNSTTVAMLCRALGGPPFSFTVHGPEEFDKPDLIALETKIQRAKFVVAISSFGRSQLYRRCDATNWSKIHVVHCGVDRAFLDAEVTGPPAAPRLVCVGRLCEQKGQLLLVEAAARVARNGTDFELVLVGDGEMRSQVEALIDVHDLGSRVHITGWATNDEVRQHILGSRALVLPSFAEGLPVVIMESLALCRPVISTYVAGIPELVLPGQCGWLVPAGAVDELVVAMDEALRASPDELTRLGTTGRERVRERHDVRSSAEVLRRLMASAE